MGSAQYITDFEGERYSHYEYTPHGELWIEKTIDTFDYIPFRFTGKELDEETNLYYVGARYLNPKTGVWISADPSGGDLVNPMDGEGRPKQKYSLIEGLNWYNYCSNNPINLYDPDGRDSEPIPFWDSHSRFYGIAAHTYIQGALQMQYPTGKSEYHLKGLGLFQDGFVDFALPMQRGLYEFYEIKPITQHMKGYGQAQLAGYIDKAANIGTLATQGTSILSSINGMTIKNVPINLPALGFDSSTMHYLGDIRVITFPGDPSKAGMIYYEVQNLRLNSEAHEMEAKATVIVAGVILGLLIAPEVTIPAGSALIPQLAQ